MQTFDDHYRSLSRKGKGKLIRKLITELEISNSTFQQKRGKRGFSKLEKEKIAEILSEPVDHLFPDIGQNDL